MNKGPAILIVAMLAGFPEVALPATDKYAITPEEHAACDSDVLSLCSYVARDQDSVIACMRAKRDKLSPVCATAFVEGMRRRHLPL